MTLMARLQRGKTPKPPRILIYGTEGVEKTTFGSQAPRPIFIAISISEQQVIHAPICLVGERDSHVKAIR
jgi:hypothetical protein